MRNTDRKSIEGFADEWRRFDQHGLSDDESYALFLSYFTIFPWEELAAGAQGFDMGCGSGRWARWVAPKVGRLHCIDPSDAIEVARGNLQGHDNVEFHRASADNYPLPLASQDFGYSLGVLHHVPDTFAALDACARLLKPDAPLLLYLYYAFEDRPRWFRLLWRIADVLRRVICKMPPTMRHFLTDCMAVLVYFPLARISGWLERMGFRVEQIPLSYYRSCSLYTMRTDALDRFGTHLEKRFSRSQIADMMTRAGLIDLRFSDAPPYWCVVGRKSR